MSQPHLQALVIGESAQVAALVQQVAQASDNLRGHPNLGAWLNAVYAETPVRQRIVENYGLGLWANGQLLGTGFINEMTGYITGVYVLQSRQGHGSQILIALLERLRETNQRGYMHVHEASPMIQLARQFGFQDVGEDLDKTFFPDEIYRVYRRL